MSEELLVGIGNTAGRRSQPPLYGDLDIGTDTSPASQANVDRILAAGCRKLPPPDLMRRHSAHSRAVRAAYMEGIEVGSGGFLTSADGEARYRWERSSAHRQLNANELGCYAIGWKALCDDPAAMAITIWTIAAIYRGRIWLTANDIDLVVPGGSVRLLTNEPLPV